MTADYCNFVAKTDKKRKSKDEMNRTKVSRIHNFRIKFVQGDLSCFILIFEKFGTVCNSKLGIRETMKWTTGNHSKWEKIHSWAKFRVRVCFLAPSFKGPLFVTFLASICLVTYQLKLSFNLQLVRASFSTGAAGAWHRNSEHHLWHPRILRFLILTGTRRAHSM